MTQLTAAQRALVAETLPLVHTLARSLAARFPGVSSDDLVGAGHEALVLAVMRYEPDRGVRFEGYVYLRVRGEMIDAAQRLLKTPLRALSSAAALDARLEPTRVDPDADLGDLMADAPATVRETAVTTLRGRAMALAVGFMMSSRVAGGEDAIVAQETRVRAHRALAEGVSRLPAEEQQYVEAIYYEGLTLAQTAARLGCAVKTVQRIQARVHEKLYQELRARGVEGTVSGDCDTM